MILVSLVCLFVFNQILKVGDGRMPGDSDSQKNYSSIMGEAFASGLHMACTLMMM